MRYLIIPDIHHKCDEAEQIIRQHPGRTVVFLGDYFDDFEDTPSRAEETAKWLRYSLQQPNRIHLMGNHDASYRWPFLEPRCPGWSTAKALAVAKVMSKHWEDCRLHHVIRRENRRPLLLSHAGFSLRSLHDVRDLRDLRRGGRLHFLKQLPVEEQLATIELQAQQCLSLARAGLSHALMRSGSRMGSLLPAGPLWLDFRDFVPIAGVDQVVGHTRGKAPRSKLLPNRRQVNSENWCLDTGLKHVMLVDEKEHYIVATS